MLARFQGRSPRALRRILVLDNAAATARSLRGDSAASSDAKNAARDDRPQPRELQSGRLAKAAFAYARRAAWFSARRRAGRRRSGAVARCEPLLAEGRAPEIRRLPRLARASRLDAGSRARPFGTLPASVIRLQRFCLDHTFRRIEDISSSGLRRDAAPFGLEKTSRRSCVTAPGRLALPACFLLRRP